MPTDLIPSDAPRTDTPHDIALAGGHRLQIEATPGGSLLRLSGGAGATLLSLLITERGPVLQLEGALTIAATGDIALEGERVGIRGRAGVAISSGGDLRTSAAGDLVSEARTQSLRSTLGDVDIKANDDVRLKGERIRLNC